jgi:beta-lactamase class A
MRNIGISVIVVSLVASSFLLGRSTSSTPVDNQFPLLARRILVESPNDSIVNFAPLRESIENYMSANNLSGSIYFEYLPTGTSIRVTGDSELVAASLMKIPVIMDLYKAHELGRISLDDKVSLKEEWLDARYGELYKRGAGHQITYREAARLAMSESDNTAYAAILYSTNKLLGLEENSISAADVSFGRNSTKEIVISARSYTSFLKCLYFGCYLNYDHSQEILGYLSKSKFDGRLRAGIASEVTVAHKIGTFSDTTQSDCGIVYVDKRNYAICVMLTSAESAGDAHISAISKLAYDFVTEL